MSERGPEPTVLIVGRGTAEARAAQILAKAGLEVTLVTSDDWLTPGVDGPIDTPVLLEATRHPRTHLLTGATVRAVKRVNDAHSGLRVTIHQLPRFVDDELCTACGACVHVCPVLLPGGNGENTPDHYSVIRRGGVPTTYAIDKAGTAPCRHACPIDQRAQGYIAQIRAGDFKGAFGTIKLENPFPSVCGRVCNHRCEEACTRCQIDGAVAVMALKRFVTDWAAEADVTIEPTVAPRTGYRVAVIGSGPAGLTAARDLNRLGHDVIVFEALPVPGGMMRVGIPSFRLPRERLQREIDEILEEGVELRTSTRIDNVDDLLSHGYDGVVLAFGLHASRSLAIPGIEEGEPVRLENTDKPPGVMGAIEFLREINLGGRPDLLGRRVIVVGGGSTAMDTARVCRRLGAEVEIIYRRSGAEMPAHNAEVDDARREGVVIRFLTNPTRVLRKDGRVFGVECIRMELGEPDESGRRRPIPLKDSQFTLPAETVLSAIGQAIVPSLLMGDGLVVGSNGLVPHDSATLMTERRGLFVAGDLAATEGFVVDAIASGSQVARSVDRYLRGTDAVGEPVNQPVVQLDAVQVASRLSEAAPAGTLRSEAHSVVPALLLGDFDETAIGLSEAQAMAEAARCLNCGLCSECLACVHVCPAAAIDHGCSAQRIDLDIDVAICADDDGARKVWESVIGGADVFTVGVGLTLSDAVNRALAHCRVPRAEAPAAVAAPAKKTPRSGDGDQSPRIGVFLCRCGGEIERTVDFSALETRVKEVLDTVFVERVDFACHPEGAHIVQAAFARDELDGAVLAACSCCALDQICYSCTSQRTRCKERLGVWDDLQALSMQFVNIREQCAFVHGDDPLTATAKAGDLVVASAAAFAFKGSRPGLPGPGSDCRVPITATVDNVRCRGCEDCETICGFEAMRVVSDNGAKLAQVDPTRCLGCGVCLAVCSSGAIAAGDTSDAQAEAMLAAMGDLSNKTIVFVCNWGAYSAVEAAGVHRLSYHPSTRLIRLMCAGRAHEGLILKAFAQGAARVLVLTCGHDETHSLCYYHTGNDLAQQLVERTSSLLSLLGIHPTRLGLAELRPGDGLGFVTAVNEFIETSSDVVRRERF